MVKESRGVLYNQGEELKIATVPLKQELAADEVLVNIHSAILNPIDQLFIIGLPLGKTLPTFVGFEGSGVVRAAGSGQRAQSLLNQRVAIFAGNDLQALGSWGEYTIIKESQVHLLPAEVDFEQGATAVVNPFTAQGLFNQIRNAGHKSFINGAASSTVGKFLVSLAKKHGLKVTCLVRKEEYVQGLRDLGADEVLNTSKEGFRDQLAAAITKHGITAFLDPVAGSEGSSLVPLLPAGSLTIIYGAMNQEPYTLHPGDILFNQKTVTGFQLNKTVSDPKVGPHVIQDGLENLKNGTLRTVIAKKFELEQFADALKYSKENAASSGKVILFNKNFTA